MRADCFCPPFFCQSFVAAGADLAEAKKRLAVEGGQESGREPINTRRTVVRTRVPLAPSLACRARADVLLPPAASPATAHYSCCTWLRTMRHEEYRLPFTPDNAIASLVSEGSKYVASSSTFRPDLGSKSVPAL